MSDVDEDAESVPSRPSQVEGDEDDVPDTDPAVYTLKDVRDEELDMSDCVQKILEGLRGDAFCIARDIGLDRLLQYDGIDHLVEETRKQAFPLQTLSAACVSPGMPMQDTDPEDGEEELLPDVGMDPPLIGGGDDGGGALTPEERERLILEQFPFPGTPATEAERRAAWRTLPQRVRVAIRRLHRAFGHLPNMVLQQVLKQPRASKDFIAALAYTGVRLAWTPLQCPGNTRLPERASTRKSSTTQWVLAH